jgi:hypothetical protein
VAKIQGFRVFTQEEKYAEMCRCQKNLEIHEEIYRDRHTKAIQRQF